MTILVSGATGYIGGRLVPELLRAGHRVRCLARDPDRLSGRRWVRQVEVVEGDVLQRESLDRAMQGIEVAYYLVHSMGSGEGFHERDLRAARNFGAAAAEQGVARIVYLGGLGDNTSDLSHHLRSRQETGAALGEAGVAVTEFRAAVIVGSGSLSFEMIRYLAERVPIMVCPQWVYTRTQPIAIDDVIAYLLAALSCADAVARVIEVGGADVVTYGGMMTGYARARGLKRVLLPVPVLTPRLSSYWVHIVTPIPSAIAKPLIEGLRSEVVVHDPSAREIFPSITPMNYERAVRLALSQLEANAVETSWSDALITTQGDRPVRILTSREGMIIEHREVQVGVDAATAFRVVARLGGQRGWLYWNWAWRLRGVFDRLSGGVGMRRGRRDPDEVRIGDALDFWRVEAVVPGRLLRLRAEMKLPGRAWLEFEASEEDGGARLTQTALFAPKGLGGLLYWYGLYPVHRIMFRGLLARIADATRVS